MAGSYRPETATHSIDDSEIMSIFVERKEDLSHDVHPCKASLSGVQAAKTDGIGLDRWLSPLFCFLSA